MTLNRYTIKAKKTKYKGKLYRSQTEALWAMQLDMWRMPYTYEASYEGVYYLPDFEVPVRSDYDRVVSGVCTSNTMVYIEVKPSKWKGHPRVPKEWIEKALLLSRAQYAPVLMVFGSPGVFDTLLIEGRNLTSREKQQTSDVRTWLRETTGR